MPRKHKGGDNVIPFRTTRGTDQQVEQQIEDGTLVVIKKIDEDRAAAMKNLEQKCDNFDHREMVTLDSPVDENTLRDLTGALKSVYQNLEAMNSLVDMLRHDLIGCIQNIETQSMNGFQISAHLQTLLEVLKENGAVSEEQLKATWDKLIPEQIKKLQEAKELLPPKDSA